jgi:hypothetical protein
LAFIAHRRRAQDLAAAEEMLGLVAYADAHRIDPEDQLISGAIDRELREELFRSTTGCGGVADLHGLEGQLRLAGEGCPLVAEFAIAELAALLQLSEPGTRALVGQSLELRDRLPRLWAQVMAGELPAWKARAVAKQTIRVNPAAANYVDTQLAPFAHRLSLYRIGLAVEAAILRFDPALAAQDAAKAAEKRGVWTEDRLDGTSRLDALLDTPDAAALDSAVEAMATTLGRLGHDGTRDARRAAALGVLADPQYALDLLTGHGPGADTPDHAEPPDGTTGTTAPKSGPTLHVHLHTDALDTFTDTTTSDDGTTRAPGHVARVERLGPRAMEAVKRWIADLTPGSRVLVTPVVDCTQVIAVDAYEAPDRLRRQVEHRDTCCVFPWCGRQGRYDLDHIDEYVPPDEGGPPGQTNSRNLGRLCRFHHRLKTYTAWTYRRLMDGGYLWTSPHGRRYRVDPTGTTNLD